MDNVMFYEVFAFSFFFFFKWNGVDCYSIRVFGAFSSSWTLAGYECEYLDSNLSNFSKSLVFQISPKIVK